MAIHKLRDARAARETTARQQQHDAARQAVLRQARQVLSHVDDTVRSIVFQPVRAIRVASQHHQFIRLAGEDADQVARLHLPHGGRHGHPATK